MARCQLQAGQGSTGSLHPGLLVASPFRGHSSATQPCVGDFCTSVGDMLPVRRGEGMLENQVHDHKVYSRNSNGGRR